MKRKKYKLKIIRTIWPYKEGYGVIDRENNILLSSGMAKKRAKEYLKELKVEL